MNDIKEYRVETAVFVSNPSASDQKNYCKALTLINAILIL